MAHPVLFVLMPVQYKRDSTDSKLNVSISYYIHALRNTHGYLIVFLRSMKCIITKLGMLIIKKYIRSARIHLLLSRKYKYRYEIIHFRYVINILDYYVNIVN
jgi:hypothetical protein